MIGEIPKIIDENYADLIIDIKNDYSEYEVYGTPVLTTPLNVKQVLLHIPSSYIDYKSITTFGYSPFPSCFTISSHQSLEASGIKKIQNMPNLNLRGKDVLIGFVDTGIEYTHQAFQNQDVTTKIVSIWDQTINNPSKPPKNFNYGTEYTKDDINNALKASNPFEIVPSTDLNGHGTMLAGIATGTENIDSDYISVAPDAELVIVKLKPAKKFIKDFFLIPESTLCFQESDIMLGVRYLFEKARELNRPMVICLGLSSTQGSHDGRGTLSSYLSGIADIPGFVIVICAGNTGSQRAHYYGKVDPALNSHNLELNVESNNCCFSMEIWVAAPNLLSVDLLSPTGDYIAAISAGLNEHRKFDLIFENATIMVDNIVMESDTGDQLILIRFINATSGIWRFRLYSQSDLASDFHIWLPPVPFISESIYFIQPNPDTTTTAPGNSNLPITVTAYDPISGGIYGKASRGFTRIEVVKPEIAAPGVSLSCPILNNSYGSITGTGAATAHVAGISAMMLEWAIVRKNYINLDTVDLKKFLIRGAKRTKGIIYPNTIWGYGILDVYSAFERLREHR